METKNILFFGEKKVNQEAEDLYQRLQSMFEFMNQAIDTQEIENAIFEYEDCATDDDYKAWVEKYSYFM